MGYVPPTDIWAVSSQLRFDEPLEAGDPRFVDTAEARGNFTYSRLYKSLGVDPRKDELREPRSRHFTLFCGHRGSGKSTELRRLAAHLEDPKRFEVIFLDVVQSLDTNNLQYADVYLALAGALVERLEERALTLDPAHLSRLEAWFTERVERHEQKRTAVGSSWATSTSSSSWTATTSTARPST